MRTAVIIPARMGSSRFPGKVLASLQGKPIIQHVYERARLARSVSEVIVATDSAEVMAAVAAFGGRAVMTSASHPSGTDRIAEAARSIECDIIVNVQGDEPLIEPEVIDLAVRLLEDPRASIGTVAAIMHDRAEAANPNAVKVVFDAEGFALYFSRSPIPFHRDLWGALADAGQRGGVLQRHIGIYSFRREALMRLTALPPSRLERIEKLEQLRALENGMRIKVALTEHESIGVDTPEDLERVRELVNERMGRMRGS